MTNSQYLYLLVLLCCLPLQNLLAQCDNNAAALCNLKYNEVAFLMTHNAYNAEKESFNLANQTFGVARQLQDGVRGFMLDVYDVDGVPTVYHGLKSLGSAPLLPILEDIKQFMDDNPEAIITIIFESYVTADALEAQINTAGLTNYLYTQNEGEDWPALHQLIKNNSRLIVFSEADNASEEQAWHHYIWDWAVETHFSIHDTSEFDCSYNRGNPDHNLYLFNHFVTTEFVSTGDKEASLIANSNPYFINRLLECQAETGKMPNLVAVDFYELGNCKAAVDSLNALALMALHSSSPICGSNKNIQIYPNPITQSPIYIQFTVAPQQDYSFHLLNAHGQLVAQAKSNQAQYAMDCNTLAAGVYLLQIIDATGQYIQVEKIIIP